LPVFYYWDINEISTFDMSTKPVTSPFIDKQTVICL